MEIVRVFVLGAGFSKQVGMPLATELTPLLRRRFEEYDVGEALAWLDSIKEVTDWLRKTDGAVLSLNIEELFDLAHFDILTWKMRQQTCPVGRTAGDTPYSTAKAIEAWLNHMEDDLRDVLFEQQQLAMKTLGRISAFTDTLQERDAIVTFNYDTLVEQSMSQRKMLWQYGFDAENGKGTRILKMHGSINWAVVPRGQVGNFGYPLLFRKEDQNVGDHEDQPTGEIEYDYALVQIPDDKLANRIENRILQMSNKQYGIGIAGLGRYKPLDEIPGSGRVWHNAGCALYQADEIYVIGFSLSPFDTMARLHFAKAMSARAKRQHMPKRVAIIDPYADDRLASFQPIFGSDVRIELIQQMAEDVNWHTLLSQ